MTRHFGRSARVISITSGKGGVGKTSLGVNLAMALARIGRRTLLADCDMGMANAAILLGMNPPVTIDDVIAGRLSVDEVVIEAADQLMLLPGGSGTGTVPALGSDARRLLSQGLRPYAHMAELILVDTPTGAAATTLETVAAADRVLLVLSSEPTAFMDAYATIKALTLDHGCAAISVITNMVDSDAAGRQLFARFQDVVGRFLPSRLDHVGSVPTDHHMRDAVLHKRCCVEAWPHAPASIAIARIAASLADQSIAIAPGGNRFFGQEVMHGAR
jgi:flagellar biosynthesis protein FlhG